MRRMRRWDALVRQGAGALAIAGLWGHNTS